MRIPLQNFTPSVTSLRQSSLPNALRSAVASGSYVFSRVLLQHSFGRRFRGRFRGRSGPRGPRSCLQLFGSHAQTILAFWF